MHWNRKRLFSRPRVHAARGHTAPGLHALFYEGEPWQGRATRVFAGMARRRGRAASGCPRWCSFTAAAARPSRTGSRWNGRGYAALAMDTCGGVPVWSESPFGNPIWPRHPHAGPHGWGRYEESARPPRDQWMYHAVAAVIRGHSLLRGFLPRSTLTALASRASRGAASWPVSRRGIDNRFRFAAPVYGCGFLDTDAVGLYTTLPPRRWFDLWDPRHYLPEARLPMLWVNGTNDGAFPLGAYRRSYRCAPGARTLAIRVRMGHGHGGLGATARTDLRLCRRPDPRRDAAAARDGQGARLGRARDSALPVRRVEFNFTRATGWWGDRTWTTRPPSRATAPPPPSRAAARSPTSTCSTSATALSAEHVAQRGA